MILSVENRLLNNPRCNRGLVGREVLTNDMLLQKLAYIHDNPVNEGWIYEASDYVYSSASNYESKSGLIALKSVI
jgi:hypothetical protein